MRRYATYSDAMTGAMALNMTSNLINLVSISSVSDIMLQSFINVFSIIITNEK